MSHELQFGQDYREVAGLGDGSEVVLRLVQPSDKALISGGFEHASEQTRYRRFLSGKRHLSSNELRYLTEVDQTHHFAMGAVSVREDGSEQGVGVARFIKLADTPTIADPAVAITDEMQRIRLGRLLFLRLIAAARERGVLQFRCDVLADNHAMRRLLLELAPDSEVRIDQSVVVVTVNLSEVQT